MEKDSKLRKYTDLLSSLGLPLPNSVRIGEVSDDALLSWENDEHYLELQIEPYNPSTFFYRNRRTSKILMETSKDLKVPEKILDKLKFF